MNLPAQLFASDLLWLANIVFLVLLYRALRSMPWRQLLDNPARSNALVALMLGLFLFWQLNVGFRPGYNYHLIGATLFVLMFGWHMAFVALSGIMLATWLRSDMSFSALGLNGLLLIALPIYFSEWLRAAIQSNLPKNFFIFVLCNGFLCGALSMILVVCAAVALMAGLSPNTWVSIKHNYLVATPIIIFAEAFVTGAFITAFAASKPEAVLHFNVDEYLTGK